MHVLSFILRPSSVGTIRLRSTNPMEQPIIDPNYLSDENDVRVMVDGKTAITGEWKFRQGTFICVSFVFCIAIKISRSILNSTLFREFGTEFNKQVVPGCEHVPLYSDSYWECLVRHLTVTLDHSCGTAKMGVKEDPMAVVSPELL